MAGLASRALDFLSVGYPSSRGAARGELRAAQQKKRAPLQFKMRKGQEFRGQKRWRKTFLKASKAFHSDSAVRQQLENGENQ